MPNVSIAVSAQDKYSCTIKVMADSTRRFSKEADGLQEKLDTLNATQSRIKLDANDARNSISSLQKAYSDAKAKAEAAEEAFREVQTPEAEQSWNEATQQVKEHREALEQAQTAYQSMKQNMALVAKAAQQTQREIQQVNAETSKLENRAGGGGHLTQANAGLKKSDSSGLVKMVGDLLVKGANYYVGSVYGDEVGALFGGALSGAGSGMAMGATIGGSVLGIPGTVAGALAGGALGLAQAGIGVAQKRNDAFKGVVQDQYNSITSQRQSDLQAGSGIAAGREMDQIAFSKLLGGEETAASYLDWVKSTANSTPFLYDDLTTMSKALAAYQYSPEEMKQLLVQVGDTGASLGLSTGDMTTVATALGRMKSTDKTQLEYLNQLTERGIPAVDYLAKGLGKSQQEVYAMISKGLIPGAEAARMIADAMGEANAGAMELQSKTFSGLTSTMEGLNQEAQAAMGEGRNEYLKPILEQQNALMQGEFGEQFREGNRMIGQWQASLEAERMTALMEARQKAMDSEEYQTALAEEDGATAGRILAMAQVQAETAFRTSEGYQLYLESETMLVSSLRKDLAGSWQNFGYSMGQEFTKGLWNVALSGIPKDSLDPAVRFAIGDDPQAVLNPHANGLRRVPRDNYPALLHEGERVLTASEARSIDNRPQPPAAIPIRNSAPAITVSAPVTIQAVHMEQAGDPEQVMEELGERVACHIAERVARFMEVSGA